MPIRRDGDRIAIALTIPAGIPDAPIREAATLWLQQVYPDAAAFDVGVRVQ